MGLIFGQGNKKKEVKVEDDTSGNNNQTITKTEVNMQPTAPNEPDKSVLVADGSRISSICDDKEKDHQSDPQDFKTIPSYDPPRFDEIMVAEKS